MQRHHLPSADRLLERDVFRQLRDKLALQVRLRRQELGLEPTTALFERIDDDLVILDDAALDAEPDAVLNASGSSFSSFSSGGLDDVLVIGDDMSPINEPRTRAGRRSRSSQRTGRTSRTSRSYHSADSRMSEQSGTSSFEDLEGSIADVLSLG